MEAMHQSRPQGIWFWDNHGRLKSINNTAEHYGGLRAEEVVGMEYNELIQRGLYDRSAVPDILKIMGPITIKSKSLRTGITTLNTGIPCFDSQKNFLHIIVYEHDSSGFRPQSTGPEDTRAGLEPSRTLRESPDSETEGIIAANSRYKKVLETCQTIARAGVSNILMLGETGTGKGLLAKTIHRSSQRKSNQFIQVNCAALPTNLLEAELFGYEKGAFTGASRQGKAGLIELANSGTLFLDEIGDLPLNLQAKLLKYLDDFLLKRLGGTRAIRTDCTIIAATNKDLKQLVQRGDFREDLYYRISDFSLTIPPLRERPEDIQKLIAHFLKKYNRRFGCQRSLSPTLMSELLSYPFPGNVRELKSILKKIVLLNESFIPRPSQASDDSPPSGPSLKKQLFSCERKILLKALHQCKTTREMARFLGIHQSNVVRKLKKHNLFLSTMR